MNEVQAAFRFFWNWLAAVCLALRLGAAEMLRDLIEMAAVVIAVEVLATA